MRIKKGEKGFSLIELMIVVGIIGILATMAVPKFNQFQAKARQSEAKTTLNHVYTLQEAYALDNSQYVAFTGNGGSNYGAPDTAIVTDNNNCTGDTAAIALGFSISPCTATAKVPRYGYFGTAPVSGFLATAETGTLANNRVWVGCAQADAWTMDNNHALTQSSGTTCN